jgi:hypothetical protein
MPSTSEPPDKISPPSNLFAQMMHNRVCPKRRPDLSVRVIEGETVVLDRQAGLIHQLNPTASFIWERCNGNATIADIAKELSHAFDVDPEPATQDVTAIVRQLYELTLLESW